MSCTRTGIATAPIAAFLKYLLPIESVFDCFIDIACIILGCILSVWRLTIVLINIRWMASYSSDAKVIKISGGNITCNAKNW